MNEKQFAEWERQVRTPLPETNAGASHNVAKGITWTDKDGTERWMTGDMLIARIDEQMKKHKAANREALEEVVEAMGQAFGNERERLRDDIRRSLLGYRESLADMSAELDAVKKLRIQLIDELDAAKKGMPPRLVKTQ